MLSYIFGLFWFTIQYRIYKYSKFLHIRIGSNVVVYLDIVIDDIKNSHLSVIIWIGKAHQEI